MLISRMFSTSILKGITDKQIFVRYKHKADHWSVLKKKNFPADKALEHFDDFYKQVFKSQWPAIREGLLSKQKYVAIVNNFSDSEKISSQMEINGALNVRKLINLEKQYIQEKLEKNKRITQLERIWKTDEEMERANQERNTEERIGVNVQKKSHSLESALESAEVDTRRLVDDKNDLSGGILHEFIPATKIKGNKQFDGDFRNFKHRSSD